MTTKATAVTKTTRMQGGWGCLGARERNGDEGNGDGQTKKRETPKEEIAVQ